MAVSEKYEHVLTLLDDQMRAEKFKISQYEVRGWDDDAAEAQARWDDLAALYDAISEGLLDEVKAEFASRRALIGGAV